jgi:O-antigen/teichoic acid export membrane protein
MVFNHGLALVTGLASSVVLARWLGPAGRGEYAVYSTALALLVTVVGLGIGHANTILAGRKALSHPSLFINSLTYAAAAPVPVVLLASLPPTKYMLQWTQIPPEYLLLASVALWPTLSVSFVQGILLGERDYKSYNLVNALQTILTLCVIVITLVVLKSSITGLIWGGIGVASLTLILAVVLTIRKKHPGNWRLDLALLQSTVGIGVRSALINSLDMLHFRLVIFLIGAYLGIEAVGYYSLALSLTVAISFLSPLLNNIVFSYVPSAGARTARAVIQVGYLAMAIAVGATFGFVLIGRPVITLFYTRTFLPSYEPLIILLIAEVFKSHAALSAGFLAGLGYPRIYLIGSIVSLLTNVSLNLLLIPAANVSGAALAAVMSYAVLAVIYGYGVARHGHLSGPDLWPSWAFLQENWGRMIQWRKI